MEKLYDSMRILTNFFYVQNYRINKNDIIKLGRVKFRIKDLFIPGIDGDSKEMEEPFEEIIISKDLMDA